LLKEESNETFFDDGVTFCLATLEAALEAPKAFSPAFQMAQFVAGYEAIRATVATCRPVKPVLALALTLAAKPACAMLRLANQYLALRFPVLR